jgi:hypothetical protein
MFQAGVVEWTEDIADTKTLGNSFCLLELLLIEGDIVIFTNVLEWLQ